MRGWLFFVLIVLLPLASFGPSGTADPYEIDKTCMGQGFNITVVKFNSQYYIIRVDSGVYLREETHEITYLHITFTGYRTMRYMDPAGNKHWKQVYVYSRSRLGYSGQVGARAQCRRLTDES